MSPGDPPTERATAPLLQGQDQRAIAAKLRAARKREFAMLRERMRDMENAPSKVAGVRSRVARDQSVNSQTLEKIERIGARLEALWNPAAARAATPPAQSPLTTQAHSPTTTGAATSLMPSAWSDASVWAQPLTELLSLESTAPMLQIPGATATATTQAPGVDLPSLWAKDPLMAEIAQRLALQEFAAVQTLILATLNPSKAREPTSHLQVQILLETYRLQDDVDAFDHAVLEYVHWWQGETPQWQRRRGSASGTEWVLKGRLAGATALQLPELDKGEQKQEIHIECSDLQAMDGKAAKALGQWLNRASSRNYTITLEAPPAPVYLQWVTLGFEKSATLRTYF